MKKKNFALYSVIIPIVTYLVMRYFLINYQIGETITDSFQRTVTVRKIVSYLVSIIGCVSIYFAYQGISLSKKNKNIKELLTSIVGITLSIVLTFMSFGAAIIGSMSIN